METIKAEYNNLVESAKVGFIILQKHDPDAILISTTHGLFTSIDKTVDNNSIIVYLKILGWRKECENNNNWIFVTGFHSAENFLFCDAVNQLEINLVDKLLNKFIK